MPCTNKCRLKCTDKINNERYEFLMNFGKLEICLREAFSSIDQNSNIITLMSKNPAILKKRVEYRVDKSVSKVCTSDITNAIKSSVCVNTRYKPK